MSLSTPPAVSVITINFNMAAAIGATLESVLEQDYAAFEAIVIDGGSTDGSAAIIATCAPRLAWWVSEPDRGLYDAMNKGVAAARGEWIIFMNSGDRFAAPDVLSRVFAADHADADVLYGHHVRFYPTEKIERLILAESPSILPLRMNCSHQSLFMRRRILAERPFDAGLLAADYDVILAAYAAGERFRPVDCVIAVAETGGRSDRHRLRSLAQRFSIVRRHGLMNFGIALHYGLLMTRAVVARGLKAVLPEFLVARILRRRTIKGLG